MEQYIFVMTLPNSGPEMPELWTDIREIEFLHDQEPR
jgi:hypothetical protein